MITQFDFLRLFHPFRISSSTSGSENWLGYTWINKNTFERGPSFSPSHLISSSIDLGTNIPVSHSSPEAVFCHKSVHLT